MSIAYSKRVWQDKKLKGGKLLVMLALADHATVDGDSYPGVPLLMEKTRLTDRQIRRVINDLAADGFIAIEERAVGRGKRPHYRLFPGEKADIITEEKADILSDQDGKADICDDKSGHFLHEKADICDANYSHARREPTTEPKEEPEGESAHAQVASPEQPASKVVRHKSPHLDPRRFVNGYIPRGSGVTAVEVYYERFSINQDAARLNAIKEDDLARLCTDLDKLREVVTAYSRTTYLPGNLQLILDWYHDGIPKKHQTPTNGASKNGSMSDAERSALITRAKNAQSALRTAKQFGGAINPQWQLDIEAARGLT